MKSTPSTIVPNEFGTSATKTEPSSTLEAAGYVPAQQLPAEHMNWFMSLLTRLARSDNTSLRDVWSELNTVLAAAGLSPDNTTVSQLKAALDTLYLLRSLYGTGWENVIKTALGSDWATALAATAGSGILTEIKKVDGSGSGLDADATDGYHAGNSSGQLAVSNGAVCANLNAQKVQGLDFATGKTPSIITEFLAQGNTYTIPAGTYLILPDTSGVANKQQLDTFIGGATQNWGSYTQGGLIVSDGVSYLIRNVGVGGLTVHMIKLA